jgi:hypothetical protein
MGRGLSDLQRWILVEAAKRKRLYYADVLEGYFRWRPRNPPTRYGQHWCWPAKSDEEEGQLVHPGDQHFSPRDIGAGEYRRVRATLSRSCSRLGDRGLVTCLTGARSHWAGVEITEQGRAWLTVNSCAELPTSQPIGAGRRQG